MKMKINPIIGILTATAFSVLVVLGLAKEEPAKANPARAAALADIEKTLGFVPHFLNDIPGSALPGTWEEMKTLQLSDKTALPPKVKELIGLGVSAQIPCQYCIQAHTEFSRMGGATEAEIGEAVTMAAQARHWSTVMNGLQLEEGRFRSDIGKMLAHAKKAKDSKAAAPKPIDVVDGKTALQDIKQTFGFEPEFLQKFPEASRAGAWKIMRDVEMNPNTALSGKYKSLVGLAVSSQIPCRYCIIADTEFSKSEGATDAEIAEAVAMAAFTRHMSTMMNGMRVDSEQFKADLARMVKGTQASKSPPAKKP